ncbi:hypothetical protein TSAR_009977 [Trichomalopsis sarcophagae]|uniref:Major facilitator superfamily (MFS) profile domain-containing protein n=1 Tax=Trichomalopsis sarcophagae TaxID=543379 RepID=A0A232ENC1_9HYME|nr:hypothetical protein TSAR_009977 [Trichomalopsis sarcophagae]
MASTLKSCCSGIPQRWIFVLMGFLALFTAYAMRVCLSIAITQMVVPIEETKEYLDDTCPTFEDEAPANSTAFKGGTFEWSEYTQGLILSSFYWGYVITHFPSALVAEKFGGKYTLGFGILFAGILTIVSPYIVYWGDATAFIIVRTLLGVFCGCMYPTSNVMLSHWIPLSERSKAGSMVFAGGPLGTVFATSVSGLILEYSSIGWPAVFYFFGGCGVVWFIVFMLVCYNNPVEHPFISDNELKFLQEELSEHKHDDMPPVPWKEILTSKPVWALTVASFGNGWGFATLISDLNKYMSSVLKFSIQDNGYLSSLPFLCMWFGSIISSWISDWLIVKDKMSATNVRKWGTTIASVGPALCLIGASYAGCNRVVVITMITLGMTLLGSSLPSIKVNVLDLSPNYAGSLMALTNVFAAGTGMVTPSIVGFLTPHQTLEEWRLVFWTIFGVFLGTNVIFVMYASGDVQEWNDPQYLRKLRESKKKPKIKEEVELLPVTKSEKEHE